MMSVFGHMLALWQAETIKLLSRTSARLGLIAAIVLGLLVPLVLYWLGNAGMQMNGAEVADTLGADAPTALNWSLRFVHWSFIMRAFVILLGTLSVAGEFSAKTLREDLLRPVPRVGVLMAKWAALTTWIGLFLGILWLISAVLALILFGSDGGWRDPATAYLVAGLCNVSFAGLVLAIAVCVRSVAISIVGVFLFLVLNTFVGWGLTVASWVSEMAEMPWALEFAVQARPWLPSSAWGAWYGFAVGEPWIWQNFAAMGLITAVVAVVAAAVFEWIDIP